MVLHFFENSFVFLLCLAATVKCLEAVDDDDNVNDDDQYDDNGDDDVNDDDQYDDNGDNDVNDDDDDVNDHD